MKVWGFLPGGKTSSAPDFKMAGPACLHRARAAPALAQMLPRVWRIPETSWDPKQNVPAPEPLPCLVHRQDCSRRNTIASFPESGLLVLLCVTALQLEQLMRLWETWI